MTNREISDYFHTSIHNIIQAFIDASKDYADIKRKRDNFDPAVHVSINWTKMQVEKMLPFLYASLPEVKKEIFLENFIEHKGDYIMKGHDPLLPGNQDFIDKWERKQNKTCCENCIYCVARIETKASNMRPYCSFYDRYLIRAHINIFKDHCQTFTKAKRKEPRHWNKAKEKAPNQIIRITSSTIKG